MPKLFPCNCTHRIAHAQQLLIYVTYFLGVASLILLFFIVLKTLYLTGQPARLNNRFRFQILPYLHQNNAGAFAKTKPPQSRLFIPSLVSKAEMKRFQSFLDPPTLILVQSLSRPLSIVRTIFSRSSRQYCKHDYLLLMAKIEKPLKNHRSRFINIEYWIFIKAS